SLREALSRTNKNASADTISFAPGFFNTPREIVLGTNLLDISDDLTILGPGANLLTVKGSASTRFYISGVDDPDVTIRGLTISGEGAAQTVGISNYENLTVLNCVLRDHTVPANSGGGGIFNNGNLTVIGSTISGNTAGDGGGIYSLGSGALIVLNSTIS